MTRSRADRLRLFDRHVAALIAESGSHATWSVSWLQEGGVSTTEPGRESLRSWLMSVRLVDDPNSDVYLNTIMDDIDTIAELDVTHERIRILRQRRERANLSRLGVVRGPDGPMTPRQCFEDLAYTDHFHYDIQREARRAALPPFVWEMVRFIGWDYAGELAEIATWVQAAGREDAATARYFGPLPGEADATEGQGVT
jgi:hypothetical protein